MTNHLSKEGAIALLNSLRKQIGEARANLADLADGADYAKLRDSAASMFDLLGQLQDEVSAHAKDIKAR